MKSPSKFDEYFEKVLRENMTAAGAGMGATGTQFSGDTYAPGDARMMPHFLPNTKLKEGRNKKKKKGKGSYKRRAKHQAGRLYDSNIPMIRRNRPERIAI